FGAMVADARESARPLPVARKIQFSKKIIAGRQKHLRRKPAGALFAGCRYLRPHFHTTIRSTSARLISSRRRSSSRVVCAEVWFAIGADDSFPSLRLSRVAGHALFPVTLLSSDAA